MTPALVFAFTAGAVATVNPCGFAMLPVWFARQLAGRESDGMPVRIMRAIAAGFGAALGFVVTVGLAALVLGSGALWLGFALKYVGVGLGLVLAVTGTVMLFAIPLPRLLGVDRCRNASERFGAVGFGLSYGIISLTCSLPVFMGSVGLSIVGGFNPLSAGAFAFLAGAASVLVAVSVLAAAVGMGVFTAVGRRQGVLPRIAGALTLLAGAYIAIYWGQLLFPQAPWMRAILEIGGYWAAMSSAAISDLAGPRGLLFVLLATVPTVWIAWVAWKTRG